MEKYVEVYTASDITFAYLMKAHLETAGIPVQIGNENLQGMFCLDGMVPSVLVPENQVEQARQIIADIEKAAAESTDVGVTRSVRGFIQIASASSSHLTLPASGHGRPIQASLSNGLGVGSRQQLFHLVPRVIPPR